MIANTSTPAKADAAPVPNRAEIFTDLIQKCVNISKPVTIAILKNFSNPSNSPLRGSGRTIFLFTS
jgi:hypothetical protein